MIVMRARVHRTKIRSVELCDSKELRTTEIGPLPPENNVPEIGPYQQSACKGNVFRQFLTGEIHE